MQRNNYTLKPWLALGPPPSEPSAKCWFRKHLKRDELSKMNQRKFYTKTLQGKGKEEKKTVDQELAEKHCYKTNRKEDQHFPWSFTEVCVCVCVWVCESCLVMSDSLQPHDYSSPGSSVHGILQARKLEWVAIPILRGCSWSRDQTGVSRIAGRFFTIWATWEALTEVITSKKQDRFL